MTRADRDVTGRSRIAYDPLEAEDGSASLRGWSSGGALALRATGAASGVERVSV